MKILCIGARTGPEDIDLASEWAVFPGSASHQPHRYTNHVPDPVGNAWEKAHLGAILLNTPLDSGG